MRSLPGAVTTEKNRVKGARPFLTLVFNFEADRGGPLYLSERGPARTIAGNTHYPIITKFGEIGSAFARGAEGELDISTIDVTVINFPNTVPGGRFSNYFYTDLESVVVDLWVNFIRDDTSVTRFLRMSGVAQTTSSFDMETATIQVTQLMDRWLTKSVLRVVDLRAFPKAPVDSLAKPIALAIGDTTAPPTDGARIPSTCVDLAKSNFVACENPPEMPVSSVGSVYWAGHKVVEDDFSIGASTDPDNPSETVPLIISGPGAGDGGRGNIPDVFDVGFLGPMNDPVQLGASASKITHIVQPFVARHEVSLVNASFGATKWDAGASNTPIRPIGLGFMDAADAANDGGLLNSVSTAVADITMFRARGTSNDVASATGVDDPSPAINDASVNVDLHGWSPAIGRQHYAIAYIEGSSAGIPYDPDNQWYNVGLSLTRPAGGPLYSGIELNAPAYAVDDEGNVTPLGKYLPIQLNGPSGARWNGVQSEEESGGNDALGATAGAYAVAIEPAAATVIGAVTLGLRKSHAGWQAGGPGVTLKGSTQASIVEVDENGMELNTICSASFSAEEFDPKLTPGAYSQEMKRFSTPALLEAGKHYVGKITGSVDATGQYAGWVLRSFTQPVYHQTFVALGGRPGVPMKPYNELFPPTFWYNSTTVTREPVSHPFDVPLGMDVAFHCVKFQRSLTNDATGKPVAMLHAYITDPVNDLDVVPSGTTIGTDIACAKTRPDDVAHALLNRAGVDDARIDLGGSFASAATAYGSTYKLEGAVIAQMTYKELLSKLAFQSRARFDWEEDKAQWKYVPNPHSSPVRTIGISDVACVSGTRVPAITITRTDIADRVNLINLFYQRDFSSNDYFAADIFINDFSIDIYGALEKPDLFKFDYVRSAEMAADLGLFYLVYSSVVRSIIEFSTFLQTLELQKDDVIGILIYDRSGSAPTGEGLGASSLGAGPLGSTPGSVGTFVDIGSCLITSAIYEWTPTSRRIRYQGLEY